MKSYWLALLDKQKNNAGCWQNELTVIKEQFPLGMCSNRERQEYTWNDGKISGLDLGGGYTSIYTRVCMCV